MNFRVVVADFPPYVSVEENEDGKVMISGPVAEMFDLLASLLNFTYCLGIPPDRQWGSKRKDGSWSGMIGMLIKEEADIGIGPFTLTYDRFKAVQTSVPFFTDQGRILVREEERKLSIFSFIRIFTWEVWVLLLASTITVSLVTTVADIIENPRRNILFAYFSNLWSNCRVFFNQEIAPNSPIIGKQTLRIFWTMSIMLVSTMFSGNFLSRLLLPNSPQMNSLKDLVAASHIQPIIEKGSSISGIFQSTPVPAYQQVYQRVMKNEEQLLLTLHDMEHIAVNRVREGPYAVLTDTSTLKSFLSERYNEGLPCNFHISREGFIDLWKVIAFSRTFPRKHLNIINKLIRRIAESYWFEPRLEREYANYSRCADTKHGGLPPLKLDDMEGVFLVFVMGITISFAAFTSEILLSRARKKKRSSNRDASLQTQGKEEMDLV